MFARGPNLRRICASRIGLLHIRREKRSTSHNPRGAGSAQLCLAVLCFQWWYMMAWCGMVIIPDLRMKFEKCMPESWDPMEYSLRRTSCDEEVSVECDLKQWVLTNRERFDRCCDYVGPVQVAHSGAIPLLLLAVDITMSYRSLQY